MKILLINDDGIHAPGLWAAAKALRSVGELFVVAPDREQSGVGASLTLHAPLRVRTVPVNSLLESDGESPFEVTAYSAEGTPGDCAILGLEKLVGKVDLVVSGINSGSNLGWDTIVSGTVGGAIQGFVRGYPTIAISVGSVRDPIFDGAARLLGLVALRLRESPPDFPLFLNINVPSLQLDKLSRRSSDQAGGQVLRRVGPRGGRTGAQRKYWISRDRPLGSTAQEGTDSWAVRNNQISITPLHLGLGNDDRVPDVETLLKDLPSALLSRRD